MWRVLLLGGLTSCMSTKASTAGSFVTDVHITGTTLVSTSCVLDDVVTHETTVGLVVAAAILGGNPEQRSEVVTADNCETYQTPLPQIGTR